MSRFILNCSRLILYSGVISFIAFHAGATEIFIPGQTGRAGQSIAVPVMVDEVDNLAGIKLVMKYNPDILIFKHAERSKQTSSLMHIANDKTPGLLIVVMAGARGVKGKNFSLLSLTFAVKRDVKSNHSTLIDITDVQLMSDQLKNIKCDVMVKPITILP
ncbi:cohesin domain-containing protein [Thermodesulfobacteriota bacterium]